VDDGTGSRGHRTVPHTADLRVQAWAPTREQCVAEAVVGLVEAFADVSGVPPRQQRTITVRADRDDDLLLTVLDEVVYLLDTERLVPVAVDVESGGPDVRVVLDLVDVGAVEQVGAAPKAVSLHALRLGTTCSGWFATAVVDV
jgi:SHS2 domain-containing protein